VLFYYFTDAHTVHTERERGCSIIDAHSVHTLAMQVYVLGVLEIIALIRSLIFFISEMNALIREYLDVYPTRLLLHACS
jgi:hypothetical protein